METYQISVREANCNAFTTYMLTCKLSEHSKSNTFWEAGCGTENGSTQSFWCAKHCICTAVLLSTQLALKLFKMHHIFKAHSIISILSTLSHILEILLFLPPKKYQNNLVSDQNTIILRYVTIKMRFFLQSYHNTSTRTMTSTDEDISEFKVLVTARFINISKHFFTYFSSTWMGQSVGFSIHTWLPKQKTTKINSRDTLHTVLLYSPEN